MKSYLSLVPISGRVRKRQNRMTIFCVIISVLLVTTIFSVADMWIRASSEGLQQKHGNWHIRLDNISQDIAEEIAQRPDVPPSAGRKHLTQTQTSLSISGRKKLHYTALTVFI